MNLTGIRKIILRLVLTASLVSMTFPIGAPAQERWGEFGINGMALGLPGENELFVWPGFALNVGSWGKGIGFEGYAIFLAYLPIAAGGSVILSPFRTEKVVPYFSAGFLAAFALIDDGGVFILNAGVGLKVPVNRHWGIRAEYRILTVPDEYRWDTSSALCIGFYGAFGHRMSGRH